MHGMVQTTEHVPGGMTYNLHNGGSLAVVIKSTI